MARTVVVMGVSAADGQGILVACSALRRVYRDRLRAVCPGVRFVFLDGSRELIVARMAQCAALQPTESAAAESPTEPRP